jgi:hypothetical protein
MAITMDIESVSYSRDFMLSVKVNQIARKFKNQRQFLKSFSRQNLTILKLKKSHRSGWQTKLKLRRSNQMSVPTICSTNIRSIVNKIDDIQLLLDTRLYSNNCIFLFQETWLNSNIESELLTPTNYQFFRQDRCNSSR